MSKLFLGLLTALAEVDPSIAIDPSFADASLFTVEFSPGIGPTANAPLPTTLPLFATGLGALGLLGCRRKWKGAAT